jgi:hypothetical protein
MVSDTDAASVAGDAALGNPRLNASDWFDHLKALKELSLRCACRNVGKARLVKDMCVLYSQNGLACRP